MMTKSRISILAAILLFSSVSWALPKPEKCPGVESIKSQGIEFALPWGEEWYVVNRSSYDTNDNWYFMMGMIRAESEQDAVKKGEKLLVKLQGNPSPEPDQGNWLCMYTLDGVYLSAAMLTDFSPGQQVKSFYIK